MDLKMPTNVLHFVKGTLSYGSVPLCIGYERRLNLVTGEMSVKGKTDYQHTGFNEGKENLEALTHNLSQQ